MASSFLSTLRDKVNLATSKKDSRENGETEAPLTLTNYQALTPDILLSIASQALQGVKTDQQLPASSSLIFEIWADHTVHGYLNDVEYLPAGCEEGRRCGSWAFKAALERAIGFTDLETACAYKLFIEQ